MLLLGLAFVALVAAGCSSSPGGSWYEYDPPGKVMWPRPATLDGEIVIRVVSAQRSDAGAAGRTAAASLLEEMGSTPLRAVIMAECFEDESQKKAVLRGLQFSKLPLGIVFGCATYGSFAQEGCLDLDSVTLMGIGGDGIAVSAALQPRLGIAGLNMEEHPDLLAKRLRKAGERLARRVPKSPTDRLAILIADAHSPKNQFLVEGVQSVLGPQFPITGGSANKNAGQTFVYYNGHMYTDAAVALVLSGDFEVALSGRQAKSNEAVIASAGEAAAEARGKLSAEPFAAIAFNCAGRKGKLDRIEDELAAMQEAGVAGIPLFGCYCAGEIGPADVAEKTPGVLSSGVGWHVMFTLLGRN